MDEATLISIDKLGADVRVRVGADYSVERIGWQEVRPSPPHCSRCCAWAHSDIMPTPCLLNKAQNWQHSQKCTEDVAFCCIFGIQEACMGHALTALLVKGYTCCLQHVHCRQDACQQLEDAIKLKENQLVRPRSNVRTRL